MPPATATDLRPRLIAATIDLLATRGPAAVQARTVTAEVGASTMMVYKLFGGMAGLMGAACDEAFRRLGERFADAPRTGDAVADAAVLALVHRDEALANPHLYDLMFGLSNPGGNDGAPGFTAAYGQLVACAEALVASGRVRVVDAEAVAAQLWSFAHGAITLELSGHLARFEDEGSAGSGGGSAGGGAAGGGSGGGGGAVERVLLPLAVTVLVGLGDEPDRARASAERARAAFSGTR